MNLAPALLPSLALGIALLAGCASTPAGSALDGRIDNALMRGQQAALRDDWRAADRAFAEAENLARSIDDRVRGAQASLNRHWLAHRRGEAVAQQLQQMLELAELPAALRNETVLRLAAAALRQGALDAAEAALASTPRSARSLGLRARLALARGIPDEARRLAEEQLNVAGPEPGEQANAHRLLARLAHGERQWPLAQRHVDAALTQDTVTQDSEGLIDDLRLWAAIERGAGNPEPADRAARRAGQIEQAYCSRFAAPWAPARCQPLQAGAAALNAAAPRR